MSCSTCLKCEAMVGGYEKYCPECAKTHRQDVNFWKKNEAYPIFQDQTKRDLIIELDRTDKPFVGSFP